MQRTLPEVRAELIEFVERWKTCDGTEKAVDHRRSGA